MLMTKFFVNKKKKKSINYKNNFPPIFNTVSQNKQNINYEENIDLPIYTQNENQKYQQSTDPIQNIEDDIPIYGKN